MNVGRLAPTPSGHLHLGNALAFGAAWLSARNASGRVLLRMEDLDRGRAREAVAEAQREDLTWLGLDWDQETEPQSRRHYALDGLAVYRCACPRKQRLAGTCTCAGAGHSDGAVRFRIEPGDVRFQDRARGPVAVTVGAGDDPVIQRQNGEPAYPLAVVLDDARDGVTEVVRGGDLLEATAVQLRLQAALGLPAPTYLHVPVLLGADGKKLSKSHGATELRSLRAAGWSPEDVWALLLPYLGLPPGPLQEAKLDPARIPLGPFVVEL